mmetsp:Transcript_22212/g.31843  ORF Transcript_22212/g.31843 Transcript_22212/m.31843 type:complete len:112 (+) Transcript_22212:142-477(+)
MKQVLISFLLAVMACSVMAFSPSSSFVGTRVASVVPSTSQLNMFFGAAKDDGSPGDYVCKDCGYVFTKGPKAWAALDDKYQCPPCGAPKFRFKKVPKGSAKGKVEVKKSWF